MAAPITPARRGGSSLPDREVCTRLGRAPVSRPPRGGAAPALRSHRGRARVAARQQPESRISSSRYPRTTRPRCGVFSRHDSRAELLGTRKLNPRAVTPGRRFRRQRWNAPPSTAVRRSGRPHPRRRENAVGSGWAVQRRARNAPGALPRSSAGTDCPGGPPGAGYRCRDTGRLVLAKGECRGEGEPDPVRDVVDEAVEEALRQNVEIAVVDDAARSRSWSMDLAAYLGFR